MPLKPIRLLSDCRAGVPLACLFSPANAGPATSVTLGVRPEHLLEGGGGDGEIKGEVLVVERLGGATYCYLKLEDDTTLTAEVAGNSHVKVGEQLALGVSSETCHLFDADGLALEQTERHPLADVGRDRPKAHLGRASEPKLGEAMFTPEDSSERSTDYVSKAKALVAKMTLEEKALLTSGDGWWNTHAIDRLEIPSICMTDGPHGLRKVEGGALSTSVPATCFPTASALASSWDTDLIRQAGIALAEEAQANDVQILLGPGVNMKRSSLGGRNFEYFSEDPLLAGKMAAAYIQGVQSQGVGTSLKHYAANNQEFERMAANSNLDERTLHEIYLPAFEIAVREAQPWSVMAAYNLVNGVPATENSLLLREILRTQWGFQGFVVSDWGAVNDHVKGVNAGLNLEMPGSGAYHRNKIIEGVKRRQDFAGGARRNRRVVAGRGSGGKGSSPAWRNVRRRTARCPGQTGCRRKPRLAEERR